jgi:hypothetical protein
LAVSGLLSTARRPLAARAANPAIVTCRLEQSSLSVGGQADLIIEVKNVTNLYGYQLELSYDPVRVEVLDSNPAKPGVNLALENIGPPNQVFEQSNQVSGGKIILVVTLTGQVPGFNGDVVVARADLKGLSAGTAEFKFGETILADGINTDPIPSQTLNCSAQVVTGSGDPTEYPHKLFIPLVLR